MLQLTVLMPSQDIPFNESLFNFSTWKRYHGYEGMGLWQAGNVLVEKANAVLQVRSAVTCRQPPCHSLTFFGLCRMASPILRP